jgi:hypothetical protein
LYKIARQKLDRDSPPCPYALAAKQAPPYLTTNSACHKPADLSLQAAVPPHFMAVIPLADSTICFNLIRETVPPPKRIGCAR